MQHRPNNELVVTLTEWSIEANVQFHVFMHHEKMERYLGKGNSPCCFMLNVLSTLYQWRLVVFQTGEAGQLGT